MSIYAVIMKNSDHPAAFEYLQAHIDYLTDLRQQGIVLANGRLLEGWGGIALYRTDSADEAREHVERDPFVLHGIRAYELFEWDVKWSPVAAKRIHISLNITDLPKALAFYRAFLGAEPVKETADFAKFELDAPNLNLALNAISFEAGRGALNHAGFQVNDAREVQAFGERLERAGLAVVWGKSIAQQHKVWAYDPDGNEWEVFFE